MGVDLRIGGKETDTFLNPTHVSLNENDIFVCCDNNKVRRIDSNNYTVSDYLNFTDSIKSYFKFGDFAIAVMASGTYVLENNQ